MLRLWEKEVRNRSLFVYSFAPFLEEAGTLLLSSKYLWHPWSIKRRDELLKISNELRDRAQTLRQRGLAWACNISKFGEDPAHLLSTAAHYRYHPAGDLGLNSPEAASYTTCLAVKILFQLLPIFHKMEDRFSEERGWAKWLSGTLETLVEAPYFNSKTNISDRILKAVVGRGILAECEGLAHVQATIEDSFRRNNPGKGRQKNSDFSNAELRKLADEIDMPFEVVKEVFESESSSWWQRAEKYRTQAQETTELLLSYPDIETGLKKNIRAAWDPGRPTQNVYPECWSEREMQKSEKIIRAFIGTLLFSVAPNEGSTCKTSVARLPWGGSASI